MTSWLPMDFVAIGYVARPHGIRGELRVILYNPGSALLGEVRSVRVGDRDRDIAAARAVKDAYLLRLVDLDDRDEAERLRGQVVSVARSLIPLQEGEILLADLIGCDAVLPDGSPWGTITAVETGPQDRLVIRQGDMEKLLPLVPELVGAVDLDAGRVVVMPPEGLPGSPVAGKEPSRRGPRDNAARRRGR